MLVTAEALEDGGDDRDAAGYGLRCEAEVDAVCAGE